MMLHVYGLPVFAQKLDCWLRFVPEPAQDEPTRGYETTLSYSPFLRINSKFESHHISFMTSDDLSVSQSVYVRGLGTSISRLLHSHGAKIALLHHPSEAAHKSEILTSTYGSATPENITTHECDITSEPSVQSAFSTIPTDATSAFPSILINAAGYVSVAPLEETTVDEATKVILPNLIGPFIVSKAFFHLYRSFASKIENDNGKGSTPPPGRIVSISSQAAHVALDWHGSYCASKAGLNGLTRCMANEWAKYGITANTVSPTVALTMLGKKAWADPVKRGKMLDMSPTCRFAEPEEIANAVEFLCRDGSGMICGADLRIDGGFTVR